MTIEETADSGAPRFGVFGAHWRATASQIGTSRAARADNRSESPVSVTGSAVTTRTATR